MIVACSYWYVFLGMLLMMVVVAGSSSSATSSSSSSSSILKQQGRQEVYVLMHSSQQQQQQQQRGGGGPRQRRRLTSSTTIQEEVNELEHDEEVVNELRVPVDPPPKSPPKKKGPPKEEKSTKKKKPPSTKVSTKEDFKYECLVQLTKDGKQRGGLLQDDYAKFLYEYCSSKSIADADKRGPTCEGEGRKRKKFELLPVDIQLVFVTPRCPLDHRLAKMTCLENILDQEQQNEDEFLRDGGLSYTKDIPQLCEQTLAVLGESGLVKVDGTTTDTVGADNELVEGQETPSTAEGEDGSSTISGSSSGPLPGQNPYYVDPTSPSTTVMGSSTAGGGGSDGGEGTATRVVLPLTLTFSGTVFLVAFIMIAVRKRRQNDEMNQQLVLVNAGGPLTGPDMMMIKKGHSSRRNNKSRRSLGGMMQVAGDESILSETSGSLLEYDVAVDYGHGNAAPPVITACTKGTVNWVNLTTPTATAQQQRRKQKVIQLYSNSSSSSSGSGSSSGSSCGSSATGPEIIHIEQTCGPNEIEGLQIGSTNNNNNNNNNSHDDAVEEIIRIVGAQDNGNDQCMTLPIQERAGAGDNRPDDPWEPDEEENNQLV